MLLKWFGVGLCSICKRWQMDSFWGIGGIAFGHVTPIVAVQGFEIFG